MGERKLKTDILDRARQLQIEEAEAQKRVSEAKLFLNNTLPKKRKELVVEALETKLPKEEFKELLSLVRYSEAQTKLYLSIRQFNEDTGSTVTTEKEYKALLKEIKKESKTREDMLREDPSLSVSKAKTLAKEHNLKVKKKVVQNKLNLAYIVDIKSYLYIISDGEYIKIGISGDVDARLRQLQTGNARKLRLLCAIPHHSTARLEARLHSFYACYRMEGEWFNLDEKQLNKLIGELQNERRSN